LKIAKNALGTARPNPSVGAVIVCNNKVIGEGFTSSYGKNHAEVNAVHSVKDKTLLKDATIYVTLEPCAHFGKTPPCADLLVKHQFKKVVIGCLDTNSLVAGKGIKRLKNAGIKVLVGVLEDECREHHKRFFTVQEKQRPYIILKWAETTNGLIAPETKNQQKPIFISNTFSQQLVHKLRSKEQAILVGTNTVLTDNPKLNVRSWTGNNPIRIVLDGKLRIPLDVAIYDGSVKTIILTAYSEDREEVAYLEQRKTISFEYINFSKNLASQICKVLQKHNIQSLIVEGGTKTLQTFIDENLWDEAHVYVGNVYFEKGVKAPVFSSKVTSEITIKNDVLKKYNND
jgi:diaminohydroxyphosphoribosylaminopyrimidine deaminase/5-amino-6-(5-phosphoribosylamino)uracil reductase